MRASCTSPTPMRSFARFSSASPASISASARCRASRRIWSARRFSIASASGPTARMPMPSPPSSSKRRRCRFGKLGGFAHLKTLIDRLRGDVGQGRSVLLDGGDLWQGTALSNTMQGADMVEAANLLGIEAMTGHWEFTYGEKALRDNLSRFKGEFLAQNVFLTEEAAFNDAKAFDPASGRVFKPHIIKEIGGYRIAIIGQAFPYVPIAHPKRFTPDWTFGIRDEELQKLVDGLAQHRQGRCGDPAVAQRHGRRPEAGQPRHRHRRNPRRPHPRCRAAAGRGEQCRRHHAGDQCRLQRKIPRRARPRDHQRQGGGRALPPAAGVLRTLEAGPGDAGADRKDARALRRRLWRKAFHRRPPALPPRQFQRHRGSADLRRAARRARRADRAVARLPLGHHDACRPAADHGRHVLRKPRSPIPPPMCRT